MEVTASNPTSLRLFACVSSRITTVFTILINSLTYYLYVNDSCIHMVFNLHCHLILPRVAAFGLTDEDDTIAVCVTDADV